jgi:hypothetical protein
MFILHLGLFRGWSKNVPEIKLYVNLYLSGLEIYQPLPHLWRKIHMENDRGPIYWSVNHISDSALKMMIFALPQNTNFYCSCILAFILAFCIYFTFFASSFLIFLFILPPFQIFPPDDFCRYFLRGGRGVLSNIYTLEKIKWQIHAWNFC